MAAKKTAKKASRRKPDTSQGPSETYAARAARGRPIVAYSMDVETVEQIKAIAAATGRSRGEVIADGIRALIHERDCE